MIRDMDAVTFTETKDSESTPQGGVQLPQDSDHERAGGDTPSGQCQPSGHGLHQNPDWTVTPQPAHQYRVLARDRSMNVFAHLTGLNFDDAIHAAMLWVGTGVRVEVLLEKQAKNLQCKAPGCERPSHALGLCNMHYKRQHNGWKGSTYQKNKGRLCEADDCDRPAIAKGLCRNHYLQQRRYGLKGPTYQRNKGRLCEADDCERAAVALGLCKTHYARQWYRARRSVKSDA
jgi:hypothetical protein